MMVEESHFNNAAIVGGGPAGLLAAILLARAGAFVKLLAPPPAHADTRTSALMRSSVAALRALGIWDALEPRAAPLKKMRLVDATGRLFRAPEVIFDSAETQGGPFAWNMRNTDLTAALKELAAQSDSIGMWLKSVWQIETGDDARLAFEDGALVTAQLCVGADGRNSLARRAAGITVSERRYDQTALAFDITHSLPHENVSTEFHTDAGPFTLVPLPGNASSVVWVVRPHEAKRLMALDDEALCEAVRARCHAILGDITGTGPRASFPLTIQTAKQMAANRVALVGEAGHVIPPIGAQGLNLGFRDAAALAELVGDALARGDDPGGADVLASYDRWRRADIASRATGIDLLNRSVLSGILPAQVARGAGLYLLGRVAPLRRIAMEVGLKPPGRLPRIMEDA